MSQAVETALRTLRVEATSLSGHRTDRTFMADHLDRLEAWFAELERQHREREGAAHD